MIAMFNTYSQIGTLVLLLVHPFSLSTAHSTTQIYITVFSFKTVGHESSNHVASILIDSQINV